MPELSAAAIKDLVERTGAKLYSPEKHEFLVRKLVYDSRKVESDSAFFCISGEKTDGNLYIDDAIKSGASCIISERFKESLPLPQIVVSDVHQALADFADAFYQSPSSKMRLLGITGTNGKTTTTHLVEHILQSAGMKVGLIGTLGSRGPGQKSYVDGKHTTPQAPDLQEMLASLAACGVSHVSMEVSSHALSLKRVAGCQFAVACLTNISQDHLDFHKTMENYWKSKRILFESLHKSNVKNKAQVINIDDPLAGGFLALRSDAVQTITYGFSQSADLHPISMDFKQGRTLLALASPDGVLHLSMRIAGKFNVYNTMAACAIALFEGAGKENIENSLSEFSGVPGRFETVSVGDSREPLCIVDYAHTPDGLDNVLRTAAALKNPAGKLICVFGCGGDRDPSKRPQMGEIAETLADFVIVTSDNPRTENPQEIIAHILTGIKRMKKVEVEPDRAKAIKLAVAKACAEDIILVAGKGHENYQLIMDKVLSFDDKVELAKALKLSLENC